MLEMYNPKHDIQGIIKGGGDLQGRRQQFVRHQGGLILAPVGD